MPLPMYDEPPKNPLDAIAHVIGVASGKGGVGKSTVTANVAMALKEQGFSVGVLDTDIYGPSMRQMLPEEKAPTQAGEKIIPSLSGGIAMLSLAFFRKENEAAVIRAPIANGIIQQFLTQVDWGKLDYLLIDFPPGTGDIQLTLSQHAQLDGVVMVTTPQLVSVLDVRKAMDMFEQVKIPVLGVVENMSYYQPDPEGPKTYPFGSGGGAQLAEERGVSLLGELAVDPLISQTSDEGIQKALPAFETLAEKLLKAIQSQKDLLQITKLVQKDPQHFTIEWNDGEIQHIAYKELQALCPCAGCVTNKQVAPDVGVHKIEGVGRYALRFDFTVGCQKGIFDYPLIRSLGANS